VRQDGEPAPAPPPPGVQRAHELAAGAIAVIFDLDGVLVDTEPWWHEVRVAYARAHGRAWTAEDSRACMGRNSAEWAVVMRERLGIAETPEAIERAVVDALVARYRTTAVPIVAGAPEAAARIAARVPAAIASSAHREVIGAALAATGLASLFGVVVSSDDVATGKPAPDVYLEAARRLGVEPSRCLVVEDSRNGVLAGRAAGMRVVLVPNVSVPPGPGAAEAADLVLERLADLPVDALGTGP
jgi:beta-phosphoglucomutase-like phosphatase (HAD superfamily)